LNRPGQSGDSGVDQRSSTCAVRGRDRCGVRKVKATVRTRLDVFAPGLAGGDCPGSVDSLPVRLRPRWEDQHRAQAFPARSSGVTSSPWPARARRPSPRPPKISVSRSPAWPAGRRSPTEGTGSAGRQAVTAAGRRTTRRSCGSCAGATRCQRDWNDAHLINAAYDIHHDDPAFGCRFIADELPERGITTGEKRVARLCS
jgi:hypothetical protein